MTEKKKNPITELKKAEFGGLSFSAEMRGSKSEITFSGVKSIAEYSEKMIVLRRGKSKIALSGDGLILTVFENRACRIAGLVKEIAFL